MIIQNKKNTFLNTIFILVLIVVPFSFATTAHAQALVPCGIGEGAADCTLCHLVIGFKNIYEYLLKILFAATTLVIVIAGIMYMISAGNKGMIEKAKTAFIYALSALVLALTAWLIINATLHALGYKNVGNWYTFTCDTSQSKTQWVNPGGATLPGNTGSQTTAQRTGQTNKAQGDGNCGGAIDLVEDKANCTKTSKALDDLLVCIKDRMSATTYKSDSSSCIALSNLFNIAYAATGRLSIGIGIDQSSHADHSCHYGGWNCQGQANAADLHGDLPALKDAAVSCGADTVIYNRMAYYSGTSKTYTGGKDKTGDWAHVRHVHISVNNYACKCDYLKNTQR